MITIQKILPAATKSSIAEKFSCECCHSESSYFELSEIQTILGDKSEVCDVCFDHLVRSGALQFNKLEYVWVLQD